MKARLQKLFPVNSFARGVAVLTSGTAGAQLLLLLAAPVLTRLYNPEDFGTLAIFSAILSIFASVACLKYELAIPIANDDQTAISVLILSLLTAVAVTVITALIISLAEDCLIDLFSLGENVYFFWFLPFGVLLIGVYQALNYWATRKRDFSRVAKTKLTQSFSNLIIQILSYKMGPYGLISGYISGQAFGSLRLARPFLKRVNLKSVDWKQIHYVAIRYRRFPAYSTWDGILNSSSLHLFPLILAGIFGTSVVGFIALANRIVNVPITFLSTSISQVTYTSLKKMNDVKKREFISQLNRLLVYVISPLTVLLVYFGEEIFSVVFGQKWQVAGAYVAWISVWIHFQFVSSPLSNVFVVLEEQKKLLVFQISLFSVRVLTLLICYQLSLEAFSYVISYSLVSAFLYFFLIVWIYFIIGEKISKIAINLMPILANLIILLPLNYDLNPFGYLIFIPVVTLFIYFYLKSTVRILSEVSKVYVG